MYKQGNLSFSVVARAYEDETSSIQFSTQDKNSAKLVFTIKEGKSPLNLSDVDGFIDLVMGDKSIFEDNKAVVVKPLEGVLEYTITPEQIRHPGKARGELQLVAKNGQSIGGFRFNFTIKKALVDEYAGQIKEYYIQDLEAVKEEVKKKADAVFLDIDKFKRDIDSRTAAIEGQLDSLDDDVAQSTVLQVDTAKGEHANLDARIKSDVGKLTTQLVEIEQQLEDGTAGIDDAVVSEDKVWSSQKVQEQIQAIPKGEKGDKGDPGNSSVAIDDNVINSTQTWSGQKINEQLNNITPKNTSFFKQGKNLFNKATATANRHVDFATGTLVANNNASASDYIPVEGNARYTLNYPQQIAWYDANKTYISGISMGNYFTALSPANAAYVRITVMNENVDKAQFEKGIYKTTYQSYGEKIDPETSVDVNKVKSIVSNDIYTVPSKNLFDKTNIIRGRQINSHAGSTSSNASEFYAFKIKVEPNTQYAINKNNRMAFYDINDTYISGQDNQRTFTTPANVEYLQFSALLTDLDTLQLEKGAASTDYEAFGNKIPSEKISGVIAPPTNGGGGTVAIIDNYPFHKDATVNADATMKTKLLDTIKDVKLYGANPQLKYRIRAFRRNASSSDNNFYWVVEIADSNDLICASWTRANYVEPVTLDKIYLDQRNSSGVSGHAWIDWTKLGGTGELNLLSQPYAVTGLDEITYTDNDESNAYGGNIRNLNNYYWKTIKDSAPKIRNLQEPGTLSFTLMADSHIEKTSIPTKSSIEAISALAEYADVDFIAHLGDMIVGDLPKQESLELCDLTMVLSKKHAKCPVFAIKGNHDRNDLYPFKDEADRKAHLITNKDWYQSVTRRSEQYGIVGDPDTPFSNYYYKDFDKQKIRAVFLDTCEGIEIDGVPQLPKYAHSSVNSHNQLQWVAEKALKFTGKENPDEWAVVMFSHIPTIAEEANHNYGVIGYGFMEIVNAYMKALRGSFEIDGKTVSYNFNEQGNMEFIGHFHGHVHEDIYINKNGVNYFISNSTMPAKRWPTSLERDTYGLTTLSANTVLINRNKRTVNIVKTGTGTDHSFTW